MFDFWSMAKEVAAEQKAEIEEMERNVRKSTSSRDYSDGLLEKERHEGQRDALFQSLVKFAHKADKKQYQVVMMYILANDHVRPKNGEPFSLKTLGKVNKSVKNALFKGLKPLGKEDIGKPIDSTAPSFLIDERNFDRNLVRGRNQLTGDVYYSIDDYKEVIRRADIAINQFQREGRESGFIVD